MPTTYFTKTERKAYRAKVEAGFKAWQDTIVG